MDTLTVECLSCGATRSVGTPPSHLRAECPRCGYLGWAESRSLTETLRAKLRERPLEYRRLSRVAS